VLERRSDTTRRVHEVLEANFDRDGADVSPSDGGYLWFEGRKVYTKREPTAPNGRSRDWLSARAR